jgi:pyrroline-5-carboxylate reductase
MTLNNKQVAFIGGGHITEIIVGNLIRTQTVSPDRIIVSDPDKDRLQTLCSKHSIETAVDNIDAVNRGDFIFINVLPQVVPEVIEELVRKPIPEDKVIISIAGGVPIERYRPLGERLPVVRALPNPPSQIGWGIAALAFNAHITETQRNGILEIFTSLGEYVILKESLINAVMALSSPVSTYQFFQSLIDAGVRCGIDRKTSTKVAYQTIVGSLEAWKRRQLSPSLLMEEASSPGGISVESLYTLDRYAFSAAIKEAIANAVARAEELGASE